MGTHPWPHKTLIFRSLCFVTLYFPSEFLPHTFTAWIKLIKNWESFRFIFFCVLWTEVCSVYRLTFLIVKPSDCIDFSKVSDCQNIFFLVMFGFKCLSKLQNSRASQVSVFQPHHRQGWEVSVVGGIFNHYCYVVSCTSVCLDESSGACASMSLVLVCHLNGFGNFPPCVWAWIQKSFKGS